MTPKTDKEIVRHIRRQFALGTMQEKLKAYPLDETAREIGVGRITLWNWKNDVCWPESENCLKLADFLGIRL